MTTIRVLVVDDSVLFADAMSSRLTQEPGIEVVGLAHDGQTAVAQVHALQPDIVTMDVQMPVMDGLLAVEQIMAHRPTPILVLTEDPHGEAGDRTFEALRRGALDVVRKPGALPWRGEAFAEVLGRIRRLARIPVIRHLGGRRHRWHTSSPPRRAAGVEVVGIGASTGGPRALSEILAELPSTFAYPVVVVQHLAPGFTPGLCAWLERVTPLRVVVADAEQPLRPGTVFVAPTDRHVQVDRRGHLVLSDADPEDGHRPSATVMLRSLAASYGERALGVLLTGMGRDGVDGIAALHRTGATTIVQDAATSVVDGMPKAARDAGVATVVAPLGRIASMLLELTGRRTAS